MRGGSRVVIETDEDYATVLPHGLRTSKENVSGLA